MPDGEGDSSMSERESGRPLGGSETLGGRLKGWERRPTFGGGAVLADRPDDTPVVSSTTQPAIPTNFADVVQQAISSGISQGMVESLRVANAMQEEQRQFLRAAQSGEITSDESLKAKVVEEEGKPYEIYEVYIPGYPAKSTFKIPADIDGKIMWMSKTLHRLEETTSPDGGQVIQHEIQRLSYLIQEIFRYDGKAKEAEGMMLELYSRLGFHQAALGYQGAGSIEDVYGIYKRVSPEQLNTLFRKEEFRRALVEYDIGKKDFKGAQMKISEAFLRATSNEDLFDIRGHVARKIMLDMYKKKDDSRTNEEILASIPDERRDYINHIVLLSERFWEFSGRMVLSDPLTYNGKTARELGKTDDDPTLRKLYEEGKVKFLGGYGGGNFAMRRLLRFNDWLRNQKAGSRPNFPELLKYEDNKGVERELDLSAQDFWSWLGSQEDQLKSAGLNQFAKKDSLSIDYAEFIKGDWSKFNFSSLHPVGPLTDYGYMEISQPEGARNELIKDSNAFLRNPSFESFAKLIDALTYQTEQWDVKSQLLVNLIKFLQKENQKKMDRANITFEEADHIISMAVEKNVIRKQDRSRVEDQTLGKFKTLRRLNSVFNPFAFLWEIFKNIIKNGFKT